MIMGKKRQATKKESKEKKSAAAIQLRKVSDMILPKEVKDDLINYEEKIDTFLKQVYEKFDKYVVSFALLPPPKWRCRKKQTRTSTQSLRNQLRAEMWGRALGLDHFSGFSSAPGCVKKPEKLTPSLPSAVLYAA